MNKTTIELEASLLDFTFDEQKFFTECEFEKMTEKMNLECHDLDHGDKIYITTDFGIYKQSRDPNSGDPEIYEITVESAVDTVESLLAIQISESHAEISRLFKHSVRSGKTNLVMTPLSKTERDERKRSRPSSHKAIDITGALQSALQNLDSEIDPKIDGGTVELDLCQMHNLWHNIDNLKNVRNALRYCERS